MRASVILDIVKNLGNAEELNGKEIVRCIIEAFEIKENLPDFTMDIEGRIQTDEFWSYLESETSKVVFPVFNGRYQKEMLEVFDAIGKLFDEMIKKENMAECFLQISRFSNDLQKNCTNEIFILLSARISAMILKKLVVLKSFDSIVNKNMIMLPSWEVGAMLGVKLGLVQPPEINAHIYSLYLNTLDEFFDLVVTNLIFSTNAFFVHTATILENGTKYLGVASLKKYLEAVLFTLTSRGETAQNMLKFCTGVVSQKQLLVSVITNKKYAKSSKRLSALKILEKLLRSTRDRNEPFDLDWTELFASLYSINDGKNPKKLLHLFLYEAQRNEKNEEADQYTLLEKAIRAYCRFNDESNKEHSTSFPWDHEHIKDFINMFKDQEDFVSCEKLFGLLRKHVADDLVICIAIIQIINCAANKLAEKEINRDRHVKLIENVFRHIEVVKPFPQLLYRLINIIDFPEAKLRDEISFSFIGETVLEACFECVQYGTAIELMEITKKIDINGSELLNFFSRLKEKTMANNGQREMVILFLAFGATYNFFELVEPFDQVAVYKYFKTQFETSADVEYKSLCVAWIVDLLAGFKATSGEIPGMPPNEIEKDSKFFHEHLCDHVGDKTSLFTSMILGITLCEYYAKFNSPINEKAMQSVVYNLACVSFQYRQSLESDAEQTETQDFRLIAIFWDSVTKFYERDVPKVMPATIFEYYLSVDAHLVAHVEKFIVKILRYENNLEEYELFAETVCRYVYFMKPTKDVTPLLTKLFRLIANSDLALNSSSVALKIFHRNVDFLLLINLDRPKTIQAVQTYLYKSQMDGSTRKTALTLLNERIASCKAAERGRLQELLKNLKRIKITDTETISSNSGPSIPNPPLEPRSHLKRRHNSSDAGSSRTGKRSSSLVPINQSII